MFADRVDAGRRLAQMLGHLRGRENLVVLGLPRGGVPVAAQVAHALDAPLDVFVVRKLGVPGHRELAFGAVAADGVQVRNDDIVWEARLTEDQIRRVVDDELTELRRRQAAYDATTRDLHGATVVIVDDGLATGATMHAAAQAARTAGAAIVVCAAPVASAPAVARLEGVADEVQTVATPSSFAAVGNFYDDFSETTDDDVRAALRGR